MTHEKNSGSNIYYALIYALKHNHVDTVKAYLNAGHRCACIRSRDVLESAVTHGALDSVKFMISEGANYKPIQEELLNLSIRLRHLELVKYFIQLGVNPNEGRYHQMGTALNIGDESIINYLISQKVKVRNSHTMKLAQRANNQKFIPALLALGGREHPAQRHHIQ